jgi:hypothetical protein
LSGIADARVKVNELSLYTSKEKWKARGDADGSVLGSLIKLEKNPDGSFGGIETLEDFAISDLINLGGAMDLGVTYNMDNLLGAVLPGLPLQGFTVSFGVTDLGFIRYKNSTKANLEKGVEFTGIKIRYEKGDDDNKGGIKTDFEDITKQVEDFMSNLIIEGEGGKLSRGLRTTTNLGLEYSFMDDKMSAGLLYSTHWGLPRRFSELTLSYNLRPVNWFAFSLSSSVAHGFFRSAGWAMNIKPKYGLSLFLGMDYLPFAWTPKWDMIGFPLPVYTTNVNLNFGITIPLGGNRYQKHLKTKEAAATPVDSE